MRGWPPGARGQAKLPVPPSSNHTPLSAQQPLAAPNQYDEQKEDRHIPDVQIVVRGDPGLGHSDLTRQSFRLRFRVIVPIGIVRQLFEKVLILSRTEILGNTVFPPESNRIAPQFAFILQRR